MTVDLLTGKQYAPRPTDCCTKAGPVLHQRPASHTPDQRPRCQAMAATPGERPMRGRERQPWSVPNGGRLGDVFEPHPYSLAPDRLQGDSLYEIATILNTWCDIGSTCRNIDLTKR